MRKLGGGGGGIFPVGGNEQIFSWWEGLPQSFPVGKPIYIYHSASRCTNPPSKPTPSNFSVPQGTGKFNKLPEADKKL